MPYDPRAFPQLRSSASLTIAPPPPLPSALQKAAAKKVADRAEHYRVLRVNAFLVTLLLLLGFVTTWAWVRSQEPPPPGFEPLRPDLDPSTIERWDRTMAALGGLRKAGKCPPLRGGLNDFLRDDASSRTAIDEACRQSGWSRAPFLAACASVQAGLDLLEAEEEGRRVFATDRDLDSRNAVEERLDRVKANVEALR